MRIKNLVLFFISLALAGAVRAEEGLGRRWTAVLDRLQASGVTKIGDLDLNALRAEAAQIQWKNIEGSPESVQSGSRQSAFYSRDTKQVAVSAELPAGALESLPQLELHETLGALGYRDHDYSLSTALSLLSTLGDTPQRARLKKSFDGSLFKKENMRLNDGGTSVSGGGDLTTLFIKHAAMKLILGGDKNLKAVSDDFLVQYPLINFEPIADTSLTKVYLYYKYVIHPRQGERNEQISIYIPMRRWKNPATRQELIREVARKAAEIFPARAGTPQRLFQPEGCRDGVTASYPATQDPDVASIQSIRASLQLGCQRFLQGQTEVAVLAPALDSEQTPQNAGNYYFTCTFRYGAASLSYRMTSEKGKGILASQGWGVDTTSVDGMAWISADGKIQATTMFLLPKDSPPIRLQPTLSKNGDSGRSVTTFQGIPLSYECQRAGK